jgi:hypothetical protein
MTKTTAWIVIPVVISAHFSPAGTREPTSRNTSVPASFIDDWRQSDLLGSDGSDQSYHGIVLRGT